MAEDEEKRRDRLPAILKRLPKMMRWAASIAAVVALVPLLTFQSDYRPASYVATLITCVAIGGYLWRNVPRRTLRVTAISLCVALATIWIGVNAWADYRKARGILFPPAKANEVLVMVARFDQRGSRGIDPTTRIVERLRAELQKAGITNARIEVLPNKVQDQAEAQRIGHNHRAYFVIWGWYDDVGFRSHFVIIKENRRLVASATASEVPAEIREFNLYIREALPAHMAYLAMFALGQLHYLAGNFDDALRALDAALENLGPRVGGVPSPPGLAALHFFRGDVYVRRANWDLAVVEYTKAIEFDPRLSAAYNNRGNVYTEQRHFRQAIADYTRAVELSPELGIAYYNRGLAYLQSRNFDSAIVDFTRAIELDSRAAAAYNNRGLAFTEQDNFLQAIADLTKAIELDPASALAYTNRGRVYLRIEDFEKAIADFAKAIELDAALAVAYNNRGLAYLRTHKFERAIADFTKAIELDPGLAGAYSNRGLAFAAVDNLEQAITDHTKAIELTPNFAGAYLNRGIAYWRKGSKPQAISDFEAYLRLAPPNAPNRADVGKWIRELKGR